MIYSDPQIIFQTNISLFDSLRSLETNSPERGDLNEHELEDSVESSVESDGAIEVSIEKSNLLEHILESASTCLVDKRSVEVHRSRHWLVHNLRRSHHGKGQEDCKDTD